MIHGIITAIMLVAFVGGTAWLWSKKPRAALDAASRLPLEDEALTSVPHTDNR